MFVTKHSGSKLSQPVKFNPRSTPPPDTDIQLPAQGDSALTSDLNAHATRLLALGFNAVRLPFSFARLFSYATVPVALVATCTAASPAQLRARGPPPCQNQYSSGS